MTLRRTVIMVVEELRRRAISKARQREVSLAEMIRDSLDRTLPADSDAALDSLYEDGVFEGHTPREFARRHDAYLYDRGPLIFVHTDGGI